MSWVAPAIGAASSIAGGLLGKSSGGARYNPINMLSPLGSVTWNKDAKTWNTQLSGPQQGLFDQLGGLAGRYGQSNPYAQQFQQMGAGAIPGAFAGAQGMGLPTGALNDYLRQAGGLAGQLGGAAGQLGQYGQQFLGAEGKSYDDIYSQRLNLLREQAAPFEDRAQNSFLGKLFNMGQLGGHTGGIRQTEGFAEGLSRGDTTRQLDAMNLSEALYGRDQANALQKNQLGMGMLGMQGDLLGQKAGLFGNMFNARTGYNELANNRAQQRLSNASNLFGFGQGIESNQLKNMMAALGGQSGIFGNLMQQMALTDSGSKGVGGGNPGTSSGQIWGGLLQGLGNSVMANPGAFNFGGSGGFNAPAMNQTINQGLGEWSNMFGSGG